MGMFFLHIPIKFSTVSEHMQSKTPALDPFVGIGVISACSALHSEEVEFAPIPVAISWQYCLGIISLVENTRLTKGPRSKNFHTNLLGAGHPRTTVRDGARGPKYLN